MDDCKQCAAYESEIRELGNKVSIVAEELSDIRIELRRIQSVQDDSLSALLKDIESAENSL